MSSETHVRQPRRMMNRQLEPSLCSCGDPWPCKVARGEQRLEELRQQVQQARETAAEIAYSQCATEGKADERTFGQMDAYDDVLRMLAPEGEAADPVGDFQVHADEEGDLRLLCPRAEDLGCLFAAEVLSGSTIAQITAKARTHTGQAAEDAHDYIRTINGEGSAGTPSLGGEER